MSHIDINALIKNYGGLEVIHGINAHIEEGEFAVLVGPSGCGKSTLLRMIAGLEEITGGEISIGGRVVNDLLPKERNIAMVFQNYALYPHMTVAENMGFSLRLKKVSKDEIARAVNRAADILGLGELLERTPGQLSGGQRQRVAMGRAIVRDPAVFLFDEPLSNLDAKLRVKMRAEIKTLHQKLKTTIVYVTHDQIEAMTMADKIIVLEGGHISQVGSPLELYDHPANRFVATFIGSPSMNILPATTRADGKVELADGQILQLDHKSKPGVAIDLGIRPENLFFAPDGNGLNGQLTLVEPTGAETLVSCTCAGSDFLATVKERVNLPPGSAVAFSVEPGKYHFFDQKTGLVI
ncbi:sn-glycerol-3-phosphate ABC transporter ATP-binding protein UgpC [Devosia rhodophyticola]|uniref:Sn-glycerol-3-phosphate ABC transporter ATP-binding protein UgpC n=1 Tax=Devosia rhodophyticola TaxID=3026423 RepID=A0ABY7YVB5_9HYPH|nr:sn-glycerol-3-phosphate ABC transporter ATP-binding protein UgpC [Devosia rhodophyticola]WDR05191.1 sn-glycerol-3-phosphate ABC transporter ATP-binding protein UgpC [Devosia rhodophyticola]